MCLKKALFTNCGAKLLLFIDITKFFSYFCTKI